MRPALLRHFIAFICFICLAKSVSAQSCFNTGLNGTVINLPCNQNCVNIPVRIPHLKSSKSYQVVSTPYAPFTFVTPGGNESTETYVDDKFSHLYSLPFTVCFYDSSFNTFVIGSNGVISFDASQADCNNDWKLNISPGVPQPIPHVGTGGCTTTFAEKYPPLSVMGVYQDINPAITSTSPNRKIEWRVEGSAPCRKLIVSFYKIPLFGDNSKICTSQIVVYESTGLIDVFVQDKPLDNTDGSVWNDNLAILGIQRNDTTALAAPGRNATVWSEQNAGYRFVPSGGVSRFVSCQVQTISGTFLATGDTATTTPGLLDVTFPSFCPTGTGGQYVVKTTFSACDDPTNQIISYDTITINKTNSLNATGAVTPTSCGVTGSGTATVTVPAGLGTAPYTFVLNPGNVTLTGNSPQQFTGLVAGSYTITVTDAANSCSSTVPITITSTGTLSVTYNITNTLCVGASNGSITVNPPNGTPPITYSINGGPFTTSNVFSNLPPGTYFISTHDNAGCVADFIPVTIESGPSITMTTSSNPTSCPGAANGSITITGCTGVAPFQYSINGGAYQASNTFTNLVAGTYFISLQDSHGCTITFIPVTVDQGASTVTGTAASTATSCSGASNGTITVTPTSGSGPYQYSLNGGPYQSSNVFTGLAAGNYTVTIKEAGLCTSSPIAVTVNPGSALVATTSSVATSCNGAADGTVTVTPTNGSSPYQYSLDGGPQQASNTFTGVAAGSHNVVVKDAAGCVSASIPVTVIAGPLLTGTATSTATACTGVNNGTITATATSSAGPYQYALDGGAYQAGNTFTNVSAGSHNVVIKNALGCLSAAIPVTVATGSAVTATTTTTSTACVGVNNGSITVTPTNGSAPYQYSLDGGAQQASNVFTGVSAGAHNVVVRDNFGCLSNPIAVTVAAGTALNATTATTATACAGVSNGSITVTPTNGSAPYQYSLDGGAQQASNVFNGVSAGTHNVVVRDNFGCISAPFTVTVAAGPALTGTATSTATSCNGASNGAITTIASNGTGPYQYSLDGGAYQANNVFTGVTSGSHNVVIKDNFGCVSAGIPITVVAGNALNATVNANSTSCNGASNGSITVTAPTNGTLPYQYSINGNPSQASPTFTGLAAGSYTIKVTDAGGCSSADIPVTVNPGAAITAALAKTDATCFSSSTGTITATPSANATPPLQYSLNNTTWQAGPNFNGLAAGTYTVYIRDAAGCSNSSTITVGQPAQLLATTSAQSVLCNSANNGLIVINAAGGIAAYSYSLNNITYQAGNTFNVGAGTYTVYVKDANNCIAQVNNVVVTQPAALSATAATGNASCDGGNDGTITVTPAGGTLSYQYSTDGTNFQNSNILNVGPGTYTVTVKDANGCTFQVPGIVVGLSNNLTLVAATDPAPICEGSSVQLQIVTNATQFAWSPSTGLSGTTIANPIANPKITTLYTLTATLGRCSVYDDVLVTIMPAPIPDAGPPGDICYGKNYQLQGSGGVAYTWTPSTYLSSASISNPVVTPDKTTIYTLSVVDANGCSSLVTDQVTVSVTPPIKVYTYPADTVVYAGAQIPLLATSVGTGYSWSSPAGLDNPNIANPVATAPLVDGSIVIYQVKAFTSAGCEGLGYVKIEVYKGPDIYVANAFTPNNDGKNDKFIPFPVGIKKLNYFRVFNRWGQMLYSTYTLNEGWDGKMGGVEQPSGAYVWMVEGVTWENKVIAKKGTVILIR
ncbi:MAG: gliding motility-associated C-terminal domain-containing protein [Bacteroidota bacterium]|nr:gliding motility-associated C-terminal domain-containing protein [Bacteroidota bacterium]